MDKVLSARVDEEALSMLDVLAKSLRTSKKKVLEGAIASYAEHVGEDRDDGVLDRTFGAWKRRESVQTSVNTPRKAFRDAMARHRQ